MKYLIFAAALFLAVVAAAHAADISGTYRVHGVNPGNGNTYQGEAVLQKRGETYVVGWRFEQANYVGTGLRSGNTLAVVYQGQAGPPGLALYSIQPDGTLSGTYTSLGGARIGEETWKPIAVP